MVHGPAVGDGGIRDGSLASSHGRLHGGAGASSTHLRLRPRGAAQEARRKPVQRAARTARMQESMEPMRAMLWTSPPLPMTIGARAPPTRPYLLGPVDGARRVGDPPRSAPEAPCRRMEWDKTRHRVEGTHLRLSSPWSGRFLQGAERCPSGTRVASVCRNRAKSEPKVEASWRDSAPPRRKRSGRHPAAG